MIRRTVFACCSIVLLAASIACQKSVTIPDAEELIPANATFVMSIRSIDHLYSIVGMDSLRAEYPQVFETLTGKMREAIGLDLLDLETLRQDGFEPGDPIFLVIGPGSDPYLAVVVSASDKAMDRIRSVLSDHGTELTNSGSHDGIDLYVDPGEIALFSNQGHIVLIGRSESGPGASAPEEKTSAWDPAESAGKFLDDARESSIAGSEEYVRVLAAFDPSPDITVYLGREFYQNGMKFGPKPAGVGSHESEKIHEMMKTLDLGDLYGGGASYLSDDQIYTTGRTWVPKNHPMLSICRINSDPIPFLRKLPSEPWMAWISRINLSEGWKFLLHVSEADPEISKQYRDGIAQASARIGVDLEAEIIDQIDGNFGLLFNRISLGGSDAVLIAQVVDPDRFRATLDKLVEQVRAETMNDQGPQFFDDQLEGVSFYRLPVPMAGEVCFGVIRDHLVVSFSRERFEMIVKGETSFTDAITSPEIQNAFLDKHSSVLYLNLGMLAEELGGFAPMIGPAAGEATSVLSEFSEMTAVAKTDDEGIWQSFRLTTVRPGAWNRLAKKILDEM